MLVNELQLENLYQANVTTLLNWTNKHHGKIAHVIQIGDLKL
jgi:hypothetical protein